MGLAQLVVGVTGSAPPPVWVVEYKEQSGQGGTQLNSKGEEFQMVNISEWLTWVLSGAAETSGAGHGGLPCLNLTCDTPVCVLLQFRLKTFENEESTFKPQ